MCKHDVVYFTYSFCVWIKIVTLNLQHIHELISSLPFVNLDPIFLDEKAN